MIRYCLRCLLPATKPELQFDERGHCSACYRFGARDNINWSSRWSQLEAIVEEQRKKQLRWDCIVPVSGGKDSTYQVLVALELGLRPLAVTATTCDLSELGRRNLENIARLGVDHVVVSPNKRVRAALNRIGLLEVGDISWPEHVGIFTIPVQVAVERQIDLILWGENSQDEYGAGTDEAASRPILDRRWLEEHGGLLGLRVSDLTDVYGISPELLAPYRYPDPDDLEQLGVRGLFLGHYMPWDGRANMERARLHGFAVADVEVEGTGVNYENLDNYQTGIHDYFKYLKFGFGRATDIMSVWIRRGWITREAAADVVARTDGRFPHTYLGEPLAEILGRIDLSQKQFDQACDKFTNRRLFMTDSENVLLRRPDGSPKRLNDDNPASAG